jgi:hypothetical protein
MTKVKSVALYVVVRSTRAYSSDLETRKVGIRMCNTYMSNITGDLLWRAIVYHCFFLLPFLPED